MITRLADVGRIARAQTGKMEFTQTGSVQLIQSKKKRRVMELQGGPKLLKMTEFVAYGDSVTQDDILRVDGRFFKVRDSDETLAGALRIVVEDIGHG